MTSAVGPLPFVSVNQSPWTATPACRFNTSDPEISLIGGVQQALRGSGYHALREIEVEMDCGIAILCGRVRSYYEKQLAQSLAQRVDGVRGVANGIEVVCSR